MTKLSNLAIDEDIVEEKQDTLPVARNYVEESGVYPMTIDMAYLEETSGGATALKVTFKETGSGMFIFRDTFYLTSGEAKGKKNFYVDKEGKKRLLPGMQQGEALAQVATGKSIAELEPEVKTIKVWDFDSKSEQPRKANVVTDLVGKRVQLGMLKVKTNKRSQIGGNWVETNEMREINEIDKIFDEDGRTETELKAGEKPSFIERWKERNTGVTKNRYKKIDGAPEAGAPAAPVASSGKSLFG